MGITITISVFGDEQMSREIKRIASRADDLDPAFRSIFHRLMEINAEQMFSQGGRGGTPYAPLAESTLAEKARKGQSPLALFATETLFEDLTSPTGGNETIYGGDWAVWRVTGESADYGPYHQHGTEHMPARPPFQLLETDKRDFVDEMGHYLFRGELANFLNLRGDL